MRKLCRIVLKLLGVLGVLLLLAAGAAGWALWSTLPRAHETARIPGLSAPVRIALDADGIPRIQASTERDAAAALGFVHARDRMFQMELMRRAASGRLSELAGPSTLWVDRTMRTLGLARAAAADWVALSPDTKAVLEAYASGVNAWIAAHGRFAAPEFLPLGAPEPWQPSDSLLWAKTMGLYLSGNWRAELTRLSLLGRLPQNLIDELWRSDPPRQHAERMNDPDLAAGATRLAAALPTFPGPWTQPNSASNEWAVDGQHSATGAPILAGDPHLAFGFPGIWYLARIDTPDATLAGATAPGVPFLVIGRNRHIAWTFTTTDADVQDVFVEPADAPLTTREERIRVRGQPDEILIVRESRHGPVVSDLVSVRDKILAVSMANLQPGDTAAAGLLALNRATSVREAGAAAPVIASPVQNLLVADRGTIGQFTTGRIPIRRAGDGSAPVPGDGAFDWTGWASGTDLPWHVSPASGRLLNANERIAPPDFPVFLGRDWFTDWRARRIAALLDSLPNPTPADFARMQTDVGSSFAAQILPILRAAAPAEKIFGGWNGDMTMDAPQPLVFNIWLRAFHRLILQRAGLEPYYGGPMADFVGFVLSPSGAHWCGGDCAPLVKQALEASTDRRPWGEAHQAVFAHPILRGIPLLGDLTTQSIPSPGDDTTLGRGSPNAAMQSMHGASYRGVYDLSDLDRSLFMLAPGQSGNPLRAHAGDLLRRWRDGATLTLGRDPAAVAESIELIP
jgi:penicillin amidase